jgi:hypothetical protein
MLFEDLKKYSDMISVSSNSEKNDLAKSLKTVNKIE